MYDSAVTTNSHHNKTFVLVLSFKGVIAVVAFVGCSDNIKIEIQNF